MLSDAKICYDLRLMTTDTGVGYFSCCPTEEAEFDESLAYLHEHPYDMFMHKYLLNEIAELDEMHVKQLIEKAKQNDRVLQALLYEATLLHEKFTRLRKYFDQTEAKKLSAYTPLIYIKSSLLDDQALHSQWIRVFRDNIIEHKPLPAPGNTNLPELFTKYELLAAERKGVHVREIYKKPAANLSNESAVTISPAETARHAIEKLQAIDKLASIEMRHVASLSPYALLRQWYFAVSVRINRNNYTFSGLQTSYGRGLSLDAARASYAMEIVERYSCFAGFNSEDILDYVRDYPIVHGRYEELVKGETTVLNPNNLGLEIPYKNEALYWLEVEELNGRELRPILIPAQCVFLFCNLDEISLFSGMSSTGMASGNTIQEAKASALLELIERDGEGVTPYDPGRCFKIKTSDPQIATLLESYQEKGIHLQFLDISQTFGIPCYKCFVVGPEGQIVKGTGAHLDSKRALISAMTETPYPYPNGPSSSPGPEGLPTFQIEDLPNYSTGNPAKDLAILEGVLIANNYHPIYVNLTRKDLCIPVVKALVPGLELTADFDRFSRVNPRLFLNYLQLSQ